MLTLHKTIVGRHGGVCPEGDERSGGEYDPLWIAISGRGTAEGPEEALQVSWRASQTPNLARSFPIGLQNPTSVQCTS